MSHDTRFRDRKNTQFETKFIKVKLELFISLDSDKILKTSLYLCFLPYDYTKIFSSLHKRSNSK